MTGILSNLDTLLWMVVLIVVFLVFAVPRLRDSIRNVQLFARIMSSGHRGAILRFLDQLLRLPEETISMVLTHKLMPADTQLFLEKLVRQHTQDLHTDTKVGIHDTRTGKVETAFYVDLVTACCEPGLRATLANLVAIKIVETVTNHSYSFDAIAVSARGNVLLASKVADILDKPIIVFGDLAGVTFPERMRGTHISYKRYIMVDGLSASGEETLFIADMIRENGGEVRFVFVVLDRCFGAKDRVRRESPFEQPLELVYLEEYDDHRCAQLVRGTH